MFRFSSYSLYVVYWVSNKGLTADTALCYILHRWRWMCAMTRVLGKIRSASSLSCTLIRFPPTYNTFPPLVPRGGRWPRDRSRDPEALFFYLSNLSLAYLHVVLLIFCSFFFRYILNSCSLTCFPHSRSIHPTALCNRS